MNAWQMGLDYLRVLVWPFVVMFFGWRFRTQAGRLLDRLVSLKTPAGSAEFDRQAREVAIEAQGAELEQLPSAQASGDEEKPTPQPPETKASLLPADVLRAWTADEFRVYRDVAAADPASAVMGAWRRIEQFMHMALRNYGRTERWVNATFMLRQLRELGLGPHFVRVAEELRRLRNSVTHGGEVEITPAGALDYIDAAERLADALVMLQTERGQLDLE